MHPDSSPIYLFIATPCSMRSFRDQELNLKPLHWKHEVLATGPSEKSSSPL